MKKMHAAMSEGTSLSLYPPHAHSLPPNPPAPAPFLPFPMSQKHASGLRWTSMPSALLYSPSDVPHLRPGASASGMGNYAHSLVVTPPFP